MNLPENSPSPNSENTTNSPEDLPVNPTIQRVRRDSMEQLSLIKVYYCT